MEISELYTVITGVIVLGAVVFLAARNEIVKRRLACPHKSEDAEVEVKQRFEGGKPLRIESCIKHKHAEQ